MFFRVVKIFGVPNAGFLTFIILCAICSAKDEKEVILCINDLNAPSYYPSMIALWVSDSFERKDVHRDLLTGLLISLSQSPSGILSQLDLLKG